MQSSYGNIRHFLIKKDLAFTEWPMLLLVKLHKIVLVKQFFQKIGFSSPITIIRPNTEAGFVLNLLFEAVCKHLTSLISLLVTCNYV